MSSAFKTVLVAKILVIYFVRIENSYQPGSKRKMCASLNNNLKTSPARKKLHVKKTHTFLNFCSTYFGNICHAVDQRSLSLWNRVSFGRIARTPNPDRIGARNHSTGSPYRSYKIGRKADDEKNKQIRSLNKVMAKHALSS